MKTKEETLHERKMEARIKEMKADVASWKARASRMGADAELTIRTKIDSFEEMLDKAADAGEDRWDDFADKLESNWKSLTEKVKARMS